MHSKKGFTVLELLVVVAVIAILSSIALVLTSGTKEKSRDSRRMEDIRQMQNALNLYYTNHNRFPIETSKVTITGSDDFSNILIADGVIEEVPADPLHPSRTYTYQSDDSGSDYTVTFCLETNTVAGFSEGCNNTVGP